MQYTEQSNMMTMEIFYNLVYGKSTQNDKCIQVFCNDENSTKLVKWIARYKC